MRRRLLLLLACMVVQFVHAEKPATGQLPPIAIVGTGEVGSALGRSWGGLGYPIIYGSRTPESERMRELLLRSGNARAVLPAEAARHAEVIVLALPFSAALTLLPQMDNLDGKVLIDPMNALTFDKKQQRVSTSQTLLAEQLQALAPTAHVVKALSTTNAENMSPDRTFKGLISIPIAGDDPGAKQRVTTLIEALDLEATDVGPLFNARYIEAMGPLYVYMNFYARQPGGFEYAFRQSVKAAP